MSEIEPTIYTDITFADIRGVTVSDEIGRGGWRKQASCRDEAAEMFFPDENDNRTKALAKAVCKSCVVVGECLVFGLSLQTPKRSDEVDYDSIYGGLDRKERQSFKRRLRAREKRQSGNFGG